MTDDQTTEHETCQYIMGYKRVEFPSMRPIDPPIPVLCGARRDKIGWSNPWECGGPLGHQFQRFATIGRWTI